MNTLASIFLTGLLVVTLLSCKDVSGFKGDAGVLEKKEESSLLVEKYRDVKPFVVRLKTTEGSEVVSMTLEYYGNKGVEQSLVQQRESVQNLLISNLSGFTYEDLKSLRGVRQFEQSLLNSLNEFVAENIFTKVKLLNLEGI